MMQQMKKEKDDIAKKRDNDGNKDYAEMAAAGASSSSSKQKQAMLQKAQTLTSPLRMVATRIGCLGPPARPLPNLKPQTPRAP